MRGKLLEEQKNKKNITNGGNNVARDQKDMREAQKERDDLYDGDSSSLRRGTYFGLYKKEDVQERKTLF